MGRKPKFERDEILKAAGAEVVTAGALRLERLAEHTGLSMGSLYHRFASREALLGEAWLHALQSFHERFLAALATKTADAADEAALATPRFCRDQFELARILACCRREDFIGPKTPPAIARRIEEANAELGRELARFAHRLNRPLLACRLALAAYPLAAVRLYLPDKRPPTSLDTEILKAARAALA